MATILLAAASKSPSYLPLLFLATALVVGTLLAYRVYRDIKGDPEEASTDPDELLEPITEAYESGEMSEEEYQRIREATLRFGPGSSVPTLPIRPRTISAGSTAPSGDTDPRGTADRGLADSGEESPSPRREGEGQAGG